MGVDEQLPDLRMATRSLVRLLQQGCRPSLPLETRAQSSAAAALNTRLEEDMEAIRQAGTWKTERVLSTAQSVTVGIAGGSDAVLNFCSNNYLGLSNHPEVVEAGVASLRSHGAGVTSVRFICGTQNIHKQLEEKIARFHEREASILYPSCFDANAGLFEQIKEVQVQAQGHGGLGEGFAGIAGRAVEIDCHRRSLLHGRQRLPPAADKRAGR